MGAGIWAPKGFGEPVACSSRAVSSALRMVSGLSRVFPLEPIKVVPQELLSLAIKFAKDFFIANKCEQQGSGAPADSFYHTI